MNYRVITKQELDIIFTKHKKWLNNEVGGERANLRSANLRSANLRSANLRSANLRSANLSVFQFQRHIGYFTHDGNIRIGCHNLSILKWMQTYKQLAKKEGYTKLESVVYGKFIKLCAKMQKHYDKTKEKK